jgi:hypothetical protein
MIWEVTYNDANGNPLLVATFNADTAQEMLGHMLTVPSLQPPPGTVDLTVRIIPP